MFLIKQVSSDLGITPQAIYKQKEELQNIWRRKKWKN